MKVRYFAETDTLHIEFVEGPSVETRDLDENTVIDLDPSGRLCAMTIEHASVRAGAPLVTYDQIDHASPRRTG